MRDACLAKYLDGELSEAIAARNSAVIRLADASYPLIPGALRSELFSPLTDGISDALAAAKPELLERAVNAYQDMQLSVPDEKAAALKTEGLISLTRDLHGLARDRMHESIRLSILR